MTGLDLESFLQLLRADLWAWLSLGLLLLVVVLMTWTSWGSRRALRKCLALSVAAHIGLVLYGGASPRLAALLHDRDRATEEVEDAAPVRVKLADPADQDADRSGKSAGRTVAAWDRTNDAAGVAAPAIKPVRPDPIRADEVVGSTKPIGAIAPDLAVAEVNPPDPVATASPAIAPTTVSAPAVAGADPAEIAAPVASRAAPPTPVEDFGGPGRVRHDPPREAAAVAEPARRVGQAPALAAVPTAHTPARPGPIQAGSDREPSVAPPSAGLVGLGDPTDVAAPRVGPRDPGTTAEPALAGEGDTRNRVRREAVSPGVSAIALLTRERSSTPPINASITATPTPRPVETAGSGGAAAPSPIAPNPTPQPAAPAADGAVVAAQPAPAARTAAPVETPPDSDGRRQARPMREAAVADDPAARPRPSDVAALARVVPSGVSRPQALTRLPGDVPAVYRTRLDPNRFELARRAGASRQSEQAVERALEWLAKHQDEDGRWDGGTAKFKDGTVAPGDDDFTSHCPAGDLCFGPCFYWEADTAMTGLALLAYLGAGYTHLDGQHSATVARGLDYLRSVQKPDGDLRGRSNAVGMYCHAIASLALCEAYALTGDPKLRGPVEKAVQFLTNARAQDGLSWRYAPGAAYGDTSILGWVVMVLKSAQEVGIPIPTDTRRGILDWLSKVSTSPAGGLARYLPWEKVTPTMTAEAWVCRQFLGVGGPGAASNEAADYLLKNGPDRSEYNLYYWYYGTLSMYQLGGAPWVRWNNQVRDQIVRRQRLTGHAAGSWDPDDSQYGTYGGRIYCTALATLNLEVYYRYLRLYDAPASVAAPDRLPAR